MKVNLSWWMGPYGSIVLVGIVLVTSHASSHAREAIELWTVGVEHEEWLEKQQIAFCASFMQERLPV